MLRSRNPGRQASRFGLMRVRSPLLAQSRLISSPRGTEMFHFPRCRPSRPSLFGRGSHPMTGAGLPHSETFGSKRACRSPKLIAAYRVLHRLAVPRHPSCARIRLAGESEPPSISFTLQLFFPELCSCQRSNPPEGGKTVFAPMRQPPSWWACLESDQGPRPYQGRALTN